jgi:cell division septation protein DedD
MTRQGRNDINTEQAETVRKPKRYRLELGFKELVFYGFGLVIALSWMFVFGILIGRGIPLVNPDDLSVQAHLMRLLGLGQQAAQQPQPKPAETGESPKEILQSLNYYEDLTQRNAPSTPSLRPVPTIPVSPQPPPVEENPPQKAKSRGQQPQASSEAGNLPQLRAAASEPGPPANASEHFSLLVSSLKDADNAQRLVEQLRAKGYSPRIESLNLSGAQWNRVLIGFFRNREEAMRFAADFNRKEKMEGLVIRESQ